MPEEDDDRPNADPIPLTQTVEMPQFPVDAYPEPFANMVQAVSVATQTDPAMAAVSALSALSACTGGHAEIEIRHGWREPLNVYTATVAGPGERKSSVQLSMTRPILDVEERLAAEGTGAALEAETRKQVAVKIAEKIRNTAAAAQKGNQDKALADAIAAARFADDITIPAIPRLIADDVTPEAAASLIAEQGGRLAIISAEGGIFDIIAGRYSKSVPNMDLWLKGHSGDPLKVDRKGRAPEYVRRPALTLGLMIQPLVLSAVAGNREFRGRGLLARILFAFPVSKVGRRKIAPAPVDPLIEKAYDKAIADLATGMVDRIGEPTILTLTDGAQEEMQNIETAVEPTLAGDGELAALADWGAKYCGAVARIAGMLHLAEHGPVDGPRTEVTATTVRAASRIGDYFKAAAIHAFIQMGNDVGTADAVYLLERLHHLGMDEVSERDLQRAAKRLRTKQDLRLAVGRLVDHGYLVRLPAPPPTGGRPASAHYAVTKGPEGPKGSDRKTSGPSDPSVPP